MKDKQELIRVVRSNMGTVSIDFTGKSPGRGAYICNNLDCLQRAIKTRGLPAIEEVLQEFLDFGDSGGASDQNNVMDLRLVHFGVPQGFLHRLQCPPKQVGAQLLKASPGDGGVEVGALKQRINLNAGLGAGGQGSLGPLTCSAQPPQGSLVLADVLLVFPLEFLHKVVDHAVVKVFSTQVSVSSRGFDLKDTISMCHSQFGSQLLQKCISQRFCFPISLNLNGFCHTMTRSL